MLSVLVKGRGRREMVRLLWGEGTAGSVSALSRAARLSFSAVHRELEDMRSAGLVVAQRVGTELVYRADLDHPHASLLRQVATVPEVPPKRAKLRDDVVRTWLANLGAPVGNPSPDAATPPVEEVLADALVLSHRDSTVARVLPMMLSRHHDKMDMSRLTAEATRRDERQALGFFLELAGRLGGDARLLTAARHLADHRRKRRRMFFVGPHGRHELAVTRRNTPQEAAKWGYLMNMGLDSFRSTFEKFSGR